MCVYTYVCEHIYTHTHTHTHTRIPYIPQRIVLKNKRRSLNLIENTANVSTTRKHLLLSSGVFREALLEKFLGLEASFEGKIKFGQVQKGWPGEVNGKGQNGDLTQLLICYFMEKNKASTHLAQ